MKKTIHLIILLLVFSLQSCTEVKEASTENIEEAAEYFNQNEFEKALTAADELLKSKPDDYFLWVVKGRALFALDKQTEGIEAINKAIEINPEYYQAFGYRATMYNVIGENEKALSDVNVAIKADKSNVDLLKLKTNIFYAFGEYKAAVAGFSQVLGVNPNDHEALVYRAISNKKLQQNETVLADFEKAIAANPDYAFAYEARADYYTYTLADKFAEAVKDYTKAINIVTAEKTDKNQAFLYNNRGFAAYQLKNFDDALTDINKSLKLFADNAYAYKNRALVHLSKNDKTAMCSDLAKAKSLKYEEQYGQEVNNLLKEHCNK